MFGSVGAWLYEALAGINFDVTQPGYRRIRIEPQVVRDLEFASGSLETVRGRICSAWSRAGDVLRMEITIPVGSTAGIVVPKTRLEDVSIEEGGRVVWQAGAFKPGVPGLTGGQETSTAVVLEVGPGTYVFERKGR
ncbi:MAG TPA: alpha-L-rhamnosidase C-terminal domain-containing protein [Vicinamibacterales bacterium]